MLVVEYNTGMTSYHNGVHNIIFCLGLKQIFGYSYLQIFKYIFAIQIFVLHNTNNVMYVSAFTDKSKGCSRSMQLAGNKTISKL